ncbi:hypothetical protein FBU30_000872 [Linnemannia zychae]|nr:hypothetical protein FBU30_000872 [Linnemannia zychae]
MTTIGLTPTTPFDIPELRYRISLFIPVNDALSCILVCKAWAADFLAVIWHSIDLKDQPEFTNLSSDIIAKHGCYIRTIDYLTEIDEISLLNNPAVSNLKELAILVRNPISQQGQVYEITQRNRRTLQYLSVQFDCKKPLHDFLSRYPLFASASVSMSNSSQGTTSILTSLSILGYDMTHEKLVNILQACPKLKWLSLLKLFCEGETLLPFKHTNLEKLRGSLNCLFHYEGPSLIAYFPNLKMLETWGEISPIPISVDKIKADIVAYCPILTECGFRDINVIAIQSRQQICRNLTVIRFDSDIMSYAVLVVIQQHKDTLRKLIVYFDEEGFNFRKNKVPELSNKFGYYDSLLQYVPQICPRLEKLNLYSYEMDISDIERAKWNCKDLKKLRIRVKGLDTKEKIIKTIELWRTGCRERWRQQSMESNENDEIKKRKENDKFKEQDVLDTSIETRVARHLLKFEKLQDVWLGYQKWRLV